MRMIFSVLALLLSLIHATPAVAHYFSWSMFADGQDYDGSPKHIRAIIPEDYTRPQLTRARLIYVMLPNGEFYVGPRGEPGGFEGFMFHSSFFGHNSVSSAGELFTDTSGKISTLNHESGHFRLSKESLFQTLVELQKIGVKSSFRISYRVPIEKKSEATSSTTATAALFFDTQPKDRHIEEVVNIEDFYFPALSYEQLISVFPSDGYQKLFSPPTDSK